MQHDIPTQEEVERLLYTSRTIREAAVRSGMTWRTFERIARDYGVYRPIRQRRGFNKISLTEILDGKHPSYATCHLLKRLVSEGIKEYKCECCGISEWQGKQLSLQLDHIDGDSSNHRVSNLRLLCPNCHTQTSTYGNKKRKQSNVMEGCASGLCDRSGKLVDP